MEFRRESFVPNEEAESNDKSLRKHLREGFAPIMACVGTAEQFLTSPENQDIFRFMARVGHESLPTVQNVDYYGDEKSLERRGFKTGRGKSGGHNKYVISPVDSLDKFSTKIIDCTGVLVTGKDKLTGENISLLTHENPGAFRVSAQGSFTKDLQERLNELKDRSIEGSIDAIIIGGNYFDQDNHKMNYKRSISELADTVYKVLGFEPIVIMGPKVKDGADNVFYDNKNRRAYICRPEVGLNSTSPFAPKDIEQKKKDW